MNSQRDTSAPDNFVWPRLLLKGILLLNGIQVYQRLGFGYEEVDVDLLSISKSVLANVKVDFALECMNFNTSLAIDFVVNTVIFGLVCSNVALLWQFHYWGIDWF